MQCDCPFCERNSYRLNPFDDFYRNPDAEDQEIKKIDKILEDLTPCEKRDWGLLRNPRWYYSNPDAEDKEIKKIDKILEDLTPCEKRDWGLLRNPRWYYRNPNYYW